MILFDELPRELAFQGVYFPTLTLLAAVAAVICWTLDRLFAAMGIYNFSWHPALFRVSLYVCLFGSLSLMVYN